MFNALKYTEELEKAGFSREQAEISVKLVVDTMNENFATKSDLEKLEWKIQTLDNKVESSMKELEYKLTIKLGSMMVLSTTVLGVLIKLIPSTGH